MKTTTLTAALLLALVLTTSACDKVIDALKPVPPADPVFVVTHENVKMETKVKDPATRDVKKAKAEAALILIPHNS